MLNAQQARLQHEDAVGQQTTPETGKRKKAEEMLIWATPERDCATATSRLVSENNSSL